MLGTTTTNDREASAIKQNGQVRGGCSPLRVLLLPVRFPASAGPLAFGIVLLRGGLGG